MCWFYNWAYQIRFRSLFHVYLFVVSLGSYVNMVVGDNVLCLFLGRLLYSGRFFKDNVVMQDSVVIIVFGIVILDVLIILLWWWWW